MRQLIKARSIYFFLIIFFFGFKTLDSYNYVVFFRNIEYDLDGMGIDIVQKWDSKVMLEGRPVLAPIANYKVSVLEKENEWIKAYTSTYAGAVIAIEEKLPITEEAFLKKWEEVAVEKRVFISFTREDLQYAENTKKVLEKKGYKVFIYTESNRQPFTTPDLIAYCMKTAGEVLVLDTENSRTKPGVIAEALAFAKYSYKPEAEIIAENKTLENRLKEKLKGFNYEDRIKADFDANKGKKIDGDLLANIKKYYKEKDGQDYSNDYLQKMLLEKYSSQFQYYSKDKLVNTIFDSQDLSPYAYNKKLTNSYDLVDKVIVDRSANALDILAPILNAVSLFGICPYYKIPIVMCPICSKGAVGNLIK